MRRPWGDARAFLAASRRPHRRGATDGPSRGGDRNCLHHQDTASAPGKRRRNDHLAGWPGPPPQRANGPRERNQWAEAKDVWKPGGSSASSVGHRMARREWRVAFTYTLPSPRGHDLTTSHRASRGAVSPPSSESQRPYSVLQQRVWRAEEGTSRGHGREGIVVRPVAGPPSSREIYAQISDGIFRADPPPGWPMHRLRTGWSGGRAGARPLWLASGSSATGWPLASRCGTPCASPIWTAPAQSSPGAKTAAVLPSSTSRPLLTTQSGPLPATLKAAARGRFCGHADARRLIQSPSTTGVVKIRRGWDNCARGAQPPPPATQRERSPHNPFRVGEARSRVFIQQGHERALSATTRPRWPAPPPPPSPHGAVSPAQVADSKHMHATQKAKRIYRLARKGPAPPHQQEPFPAPHRFMCTSSPSLVITRPRTGAQASPKRAKERWCHRLSKEALPHPLPPHPPPPAQSHACVAFWLSTPHLPHPRPRQGRQGSSC